MWYKKIIFTIVLGCLVFSGVILILPGRTLATNGGGLGSISVSDWLTQRAITTGWAEWAAEQAKKKAEQSLASRLFQSMNLLIANG